MKQISSQSFHSLALSLALAASVGLVALTPMPAHAIWASEITQGMNNAELVASTKKLKDQYDSLMDQLNTLQKQYDQLNPGNFNLGAITGFRDNNGEFRERATDYGIEVCEEGKSSVKTQQLAICKKSVEIRNLRFNAMVKMLKDVKTRDDEIKRLLDKRKTLTAAADKGQLDANTNDVVRLQAQMENDIQNGKYTLDTYTAILNTLNDDMVATAQRALLNKPVPKKEGFTLPPILGKVVQGAALKFALSQAGKRDL
ncbi:MULTISPECIES: hypothetical protein [Lysobacter]|jgi:hypothetical protein|uniref:Type IV secretion system protein n=1 Tax=Lysobacter gummosus TaxID=262324 RepID=A0ABY3XCH2_9GAMM|nr:MULTISPECIES: hypothetical protein [Lysobacter]ALN91773.1 hypothetical protein LG3211_2806 [Lysobacter gummosus]UJB21222.1 type IV secretion system protein [Lysobacter capsici]UJQ29662.1 type IV secretion system protein [Lysobacter gummosus]UNP27443.1 type IV secretion system protein [Lysobacter gummosus]